jgi:hypothetical protein
MSRLYRRIGYGQKNKNRQAFQAGGCVGAGVSRVERALDSFRQRPESQKNKTRRTTSFS